MPATLDLVPWCKVKRERWETGECGSESWPSRPE